MSDFEARRHQIRAPDIVNKAIDLTVLVLTMCDWNAQHRLSLKL